MCFDSQHNGYISSDKINLDSVSVDVLEVFTPLLIEMEKLDETLDKEEFI